MESSRSSWVKMGSLGSPRRPSTDGTSSRACTRPARKLCSSLWRVRTYDDQCPRCVIAAGSSLVHRQCICGRGFRPLRRRSLYRSGECCSPKSHCDKKQLAASFHFRSPLMAFWYKDQLNDLKSHRIRLLLLPSRRNCGVRRGLLYPPGRTSPRSGPL